MADSNSHFLIKKDTAKVVEIVASGAIIGAIVAVPLAILLFSEVTSNPVEHAPVIGAVLGGLITFAGRLTKNSKRGRG
ncbi:MAG TPA: hypothetical protein EYP53_04240 [Candidatus Latescibacteria bacterium]|nr:hypothetical protein [Candidatus Latescibacterota bacterium]